MDEKVICLRCGQCCYFIIEGVTHKCNHLVRLSNGKTLCRVYKTRLGRILFQSSEGTTICKKRIEVKTYYPGCPYNRLIKEEKNGTQN